MIQMLDWPKFLTLLNSPGVKLHSLPVVSISQDITKKAVELANEQGGYLLLGFDRYNLSLTGCNFDSKWLNAILASEIKPAIDFEIIGFIRNNKRVFAVKVNEGTKKPHSIFGGSLIKIKQTEREIRLSDDVSLESVKKRQSRCLDYLDAHNDITNARYRELNAVSYKTAHNELSDLVDKKILAQAGQARNTKYLLYKNLDKYQTEESEVNLFGQTLDTLIDLNSDTKSRTEIRRSQNNDHMESHLSKNVLPEEPDALFRADFNDLDTPG
jgi:predicted HTH transcriptional regulator